MATPHFPLSLTFRLTSFMAKQFNFLSMPAADLNSLSRNRITQCQLSIFITAHSAHNLEENPGVLMKRKSQLFEIEFNRNFCRTAILVQLLLPNVGSSHSCFGLAYH